MWNAVDEKRPDAKECVDSLLLSDSAVELGYKIQGLSAHILLRLGHRVTAVNGSGHPDIVSTKNGEQFRFEIEAEVGGPRNRRLTDDDFHSLLDERQGTGYFALAICFPAPYWVLVPAAKLRSRSLASANVLLEALSDKQLSADWTSEYISLLQNSCDRIREMSFAHLRDRALEGRML